MRLAIFNFRTSKEFVKLIKLASELVGARNVSVFVRAVLRRESLKILRGHAPKGARKRHRKKSA